MTGLRAPISALVFSLMLSGCYTQVPITNAPLSSTHLIASVTDSGVVAMAKAIGSGAERVEGIVETATRDTLTLQMLRVDHRTGADVVWNHELVKFPSYALANPAESRFDRKRTWMAAVGIGLGAFLAARAFQSLGADEPVDQTPNPAATLVIPFRLFR